MQPNTVVVKNYLASIIATIKVLSTPLFGDLYCFFEADGEEF
jgi:hypothetical protein